MVVLSQEKKRIINKYIINNLITQRIIAYERKISAKIVIL